MEIEYKDWDKVVKQMEATTKSDAMTSAINDKVLDFAIMQRDSYPKPDKEDESN